MTVFNNLIVFGIAASAWFAAPLDHSNKSTVSVEVKALAKARNNKSTVKLDTLHVPRASELVAERLRSLIVLGQVAAGVSLPSEKELVSQLGVSRATLREALRMLETEGLIATRAGAKGGSVVQKPGSASLTRSLSLLLQLEDTPFDTILEARRLLEPLCARLAATRATATEIEQLHHYIEAMHHSIGDVPAYVAAQLDFHLTVITSAHNNVLRLYTISVGELISHQAASLGLSEAEQLTGVKAVEGILNAIIKHNGKLAARRTEAHLRGFEAVLLGKLKLVNANK